MSNAILHSCASDVQPDATAGPNMEQALAYAEALTGSRSHPLTLVGIGPGDQTEARRGAVTNLWAWITARQGEGWGIFATVNETRGTKRKKSC